MSPERNFINCVHTTLCLITVIVAITHGQVNTTTTSTGTTISGTTGITTTGITTTGITTKGITTTGITTTGITTKGITTKGITTTGTTTGTTTTTTGTTTTTTTGTTTGTATGTTTGTTTALITTTPGRPKHPVFTQLSSTVFALKESVKANIDLTSFQCEDPNGKNTIVDIKKTFAPNSACYLCFDVIPCNPNNVKNSKDWCVRYTPTLGSLDITATNLYEFIFTCRNVDGDESTEHFQVRVIRDTVPPTFNLPASVTLLESEKMEKTLQQLQCTDADVNQTVKMDVASVKPISGNCARCFAILSCGKTGADWCLKYVPSGSLNYAVTNTYTVSLRCTDSQGLSVTKDIDVHIDKNTPPVFDPDVGKVTNTVPNAVTTKKDDQVFQVISIDANKDDVLRYRLETEPDKDDYEIELTTGIIRAKKDLSSACYASTTLKAYVSDGVNPEVGPLLIHTDLTNSNKAPTISNLDFVKQVPEDTPVNSPIYQINAKDNAKPNTVTFMMSALPKDGLNIFKIDPNTGEVRVAATLDYEDKLLSRRFKLQVHATDGSCVSDTKTLTIDITDVNEKPKVTPVITTLTVDEGIIDIDSSHWTVTDPDFRDDHTYSFVSGNNDNYFSIDPTTGRITSTLDYDIDQNKMPKKVPLKIRVTDKGGKTDHFIIHLKVQDINDNPPVITRPYSHSYVVNNCTGPGTELGQLRATDRDSSYRYNNEIYFESTSSGSIAVTNTGKIVLTSKMAPGTTSSITGIARDKGLRPYPLASAPVSISVRSTVCPPPRKKRPVTKPPTTPKATQPPIIITLPVPRPPPTVKPLRSTTAATITTKATHVDNWFDDNLPWIILSALLGTIFLGLTTFLCWRYVLPACRGIRCCKPRAARPVRKTKVKPTPRPKSPTPQRQLTPVEKPLDPIPLRTPTPQPPSIVGPQDGNLTGFWKEHYNEHDLSAMPKRNVLPKPSSDAVNPLFGPNPVTKPGQDSAKPAKNCVIQ